MMKRSLEKIVLKEKMEELPNAMHPWRKEKVTKGGNGENLMIYGFKPIEVDILHIIWHCTKSDIPDKIDYKNIW